MNNGYLSAGSPQSSMRLAFMIVIITSCVIALGAVMLCILLNRDMLGGVAAVLSALLIAAFGGKAIQSYSENKYTYKSISDPE